MKILLTNDDGFDAPGIEALWRAALALGEPIIAAPAVPQSGCSHRVTTSGPIRVESLASTHSGAKGQGYIVHGTPADCVRLALCRLAPDVDWVLAGINAGGNLGADVHHSGTVAAVREAALHGKPGIALSHYQQRGWPIDWQRAARWATPLLRDLHARPHAPGTLWNINLPHLAPDAPDPAVVFCPLESGPLPLSFRLEGDLHFYDGDYHQRPRASGSDVDVCFNGRIAVTQIVLY